MIDLTPITNLFDEHPALLWWIAVGSALIFVGSLISVPWIVVRIPSDYFATRRRPQTRFARQHPLLRWTIWTLRNLFGVALIAAGAAMLVLPGQGLLTIAVGVVLMDFPGKHRFERRIVRTRPIWKSIGWLRRRADVEPLWLDSDSPARIEKR